MKMRMMLAAAITAAALSVGCGGTAVRADRDAPAQAAAAPQIEVTTVVAQPLKASVPLPAELQAFESVPMYPKVTGFVRTIAVDRGSRVRRGEVIARLDAPELMAQRAEAQAKLESAQAQLAAAQAKLASDDATHRRLAAASATPGVVAGNDLDTSAKTVDADRALVDSQQQAVAAAKQTVQAIADVASYLDIRAPFDGVVTERNVHPGALVGPGGGTSGAPPMVRIDSVSKLRLVVPVPESYVAGVREGRSVEFVVPSYPGRTFTGTIARIARAVAPKTRTMPVELDVANADGALAPGTFADVRWPIERPAPTLFVPPSAVASTLDRTFVVRVRNGKAEWVDVTTGVTAGDRVEVFGPLAAGDQVAVRGTDEVKAGTAVAARTAAGKD
jgi:RND family efflux transporter MFP subunit